MDSPSWKPCAVLVIVSVLPKVEAAWVPVLILLTKLALAYTIPATYVALGTVIVYVSAVTEFIVYIFSLKIGQIIRYFIDFHHFTLWVLSLFYHIQPFDEKM